MTNNITFTLVDAIKPETLAKKYSLENGSLKKEVSAHLSKGRIIRQTVSDLSAFGGFIETLHTSQVLIYGVTTSGSDATIVSSKQLAASGHDQSVIARTKNFLAWHDGPSIFMIDVDHEAGRESYTGKELVAKLRETVPELSGASILHHLSSSSNIYDEAGRALTGERGHRLYIAVTDGRDIPRFASQLEIRLWAAGHGYIKISKSGAMLERTLIDLTVYQENRIDFAAGAALGEGLRQDRGRPQLFPALTESTDLYDSKVQLPDADRVLVQRAKSAKDKARYIAKPDAEKRRVEWKKERAADLAKSADGLDGENESSLDLALDERILSNDFILQVRPRGAKDYEKITVAEILGDVQRYNRAECRDPLEPTYRDGAPVGMLFLLGNPRLHSFARGGATYKLARELQDIELIRGQTHVATDQLSALMRKTGLFFDQGDVLVTINDGRPHTLLPAALAYTIAKHAQFSRAAGPKGARVDIDPPVEVLKQLVELGKMRSLPVLRGTSSMPIIQCDGTILTQPGYDPVSTIFGDFSEDAFESVSFEPTIDGYQEALDVLLRPFDEVRFANDESHSVLLAALLTALCRTAIDKAPAFIADASSPGAGKSMLCEAIGALMIGSPPATMAPLSEGSEDEIRKRMMSALLPPAEPVINIDNQNGRVDSRVLSQLLTSATMTDRLLGQNKLASEIPNRALILMSGNNIEFSEELSRRVMRMKLEVSSDGVFVRRFKRDVVQTVLDTRERMVMAGLSLMRAALRAETPGNGSTVPSYREWDRMVRQTILWINSTLGKSYIDPLDIMQRAMTSSPERHEIYPLLECLEVVFGDETFTASSLLTSGNLGIEAQLRGLTGRSGLPSTQSIGIHLSRLRDRIIGDLVLRHRIVSHTAHYHIEKVGAFDPKVRKEK